MTSQRGVKPLTSVLKPRPEVLKGGIVEAVNLANIYVYNELRDKVPQEILESESPLVHPDEFLKRTYFTDSMKRVILKVFGALSGASYVYLDERGTEKIPVDSRVFIIPSHLGGGKSHLLATLYHIARLLNENRLDVINAYIGDRELAFSLSYLARNIKDTYGKIHVVAIVGDVRVLAPSPDRPLDINGVRIHTPWGLLGFLLGAYEEVKSADELHYAPKKDELRRILHGKSALILIDEPVEYMELATRLESRPEYRGFKESFVSFIRNLAEAVSETPGCVLVVTLPAEYRDKEGQLQPSAQHPEYVEELSGMLTRVAHEFIPPFGTSKDIVEVFKKRLFENITAKDVEDAITLVIEDIKRKAGSDSTFREAVKVKYGDLAEFIELVKESYPFHPAFVEVLVNIAASIPELGLTRYLLSYTARLVKYLYDLKERQRGEDPASSPYNTMGYTTRRARV